MKTSPIQVTIERVEVGPVLVVGPDLDELALDVGIVLSLAGRESTSVARVSMPAAELERLGWSPGDFRAHVASQLGVGLVGVVAKPAREVLDRRARISYGRELLRTAAVGARLAATVNRIREELAGLTDRVATFGDAVTEELRTLGDFIGSGEVIGPPEPVTAYSHPDGFAPPRAAADELEPRDLDRPGMLAVVSKRIETLLDTAALRGFSGVDLNGEPWLHGIGPLELRLFFFETIRTGVTLLADTPSELLADFMNWLRAARRAR